MMMPRTHWLPVLWVGVLIAGACKAEKVDFGSCYAAWENGRLTVGNTLFERVWVANDGGLAPISFIIKNPEIEWLADSERQSKTTGTLGVQSSIRRRSVVGAEGLHLRVTVQGKTSHHVSLWLFPHTAGVLEERLDPGASTSSVKAAATSGIEVEPQAPQITTTGAGAETLRMAPQHLRVTQVDLMDQTDSHNELLTEREWLLSPNESRIDVQGCVLITENVIDGAGLVAVKLAPLPHARPDKDAIDFQINPRGRSISSFSNDYPVAMIGYHGGRVGRIRAMQSFQRSLREYKPERDGLFLSNTWGDRSRDARINEAFLLKEVEAGAVLGVDVVQIDDGWQKGRTANSAALVGKGAWNGYWAADPNFWDADAVRFPSGLMPVIQAARDRNMGFGLWFGPDSTHDAANWQKDANLMLKYHRELGVNYFKIDSMKTLNATSLHHQREMFDQIQEGSDGEIVVDLDVTAEIRPGYFGLPDTGPIFVENRYTDFHNYWPHQTLRNLWMLAQVVDPLRLRMELLNNTRNQGKYPGDPLAPALYKPDTLFAITMMANPLGWFEVSNLPDDYISSVRSLVAVWKTERERMHGGSIIPVGSAPDGVSWTGFASSAADGKGGYLLLFRELSEKPDYSLPFLDHPCSSSLFVPGVTRASVIGGRGTARLADESLIVNIPEKLDYIWIKLD